MVNVDIDNNLYYKIKKLVIGNKLKYPSVKFFVQKIILDGLEDMEKSLLDKPSTLLESVDGKKSLEGKEGSRKENED